MKAGYVIDANVLTTSAKCLDHGDREPYKHTTLELPVAHLPCKLPKNITDLTETARKMEHGVKMSFGPPVSLESWLEVGLELTTEICVQVAEVLCPPTQHHLLEDRERRREKLYRRTEHKLLGRTIPTRNTLPLFTGHPGFRFGVPTIDDITAAEIMYPPPEEPTADDDKIRARYILSHESFLPGEKKHYYGPDFKVPDRGNETGRQYNNNVGTRTKEVLYSAVELNNIKDTMSHLPSDHAFGVSFEPDEYKVGDLIGYGRRKPAFAEENRSAPDLIVSARLRKQKMMEEIAPKITSTPVGGVRPERYALVPETMVFGLPTVRGRKRPGYHKKLDDENNYGDQLCAKALLLPTPLNTYGPDLLDTLRRQFKSERDERNHYEQAICPRKVPAIPAVMTA
ncbi:hypothetical protein HK101_001088 [Irineochytrium annulatum]|nr:hypothetical protein HK101_001088 [Irineochytrium annulatum]